MSKTSFFQRFRILCNFSGRKIWSSRFLVLALHILSISQCGVSHSTSNTVSVRNSLLRPGFGKESRSDEDGNSLSEVWLTSHLVPSAVNGTGNSPSQPDQITSIGTFPPPSSISLVKGSRQDTSDIEVILTSNAIISPDIYIGRFVDSKVTIDDALLEELGLSTVTTRRPVSTSATAKPNDGGNHDRSPTDRLSIARGQQSTTTHKNLVGGSIANDSDISIFTFASRVQARNDSRDEHRLNKFEYHDNARGRSNDGGDIETLSRRGARNQPCYQKFNATSGRFELNFTQDCIYLLVSPSANSRVILHCENVHLSNCSVNRDTLTVNLKGDLRFGRNSYLYCGSNVHVRTTSLRRRISIRVRQDLNVRAVTECNFFARKERNYNDEAASSQGIGECGRHGRNSKIVGGRSVEPGVFPWVCQLDITRTDGTQTACTGSLISNQYVLTAAHCLKNAESISVFLGGTDRLAFTGSEVTIQAEKFILHRSWNPRTLIADLALVKLTESLRFTDEISPVCLPERSLRRETMTGRKGVAAGWGRLDTSEKAPQQLYRVKLPFLSDALCYLAYRRFFKRDLMMCTESTVEKSICYGDSGGPLMYKRKEKVYQLGVASYSSSKICGESYDVFTKLGDEYVEWINKRIHESS